MHGAGRGRPLRAEQVFEGRDAVQCSATQKRGRCNRMVRTIQGAAANLERLPGLCNNTTGLGTRGLLGTARNKAHTLSDQADLRQKGLKVQRWTVRQEEWNQPLIPTGLEPGPISLLSVWPPVLERSSHGSHSSWMGLAEPAALNGEGSDAWRRAC